MVAIVANTLMFFLLALYVAFLEVELQSILGNDWLYTIEILRNAYGVLAKKTWLQQPK
jgi:hypothetical protein